MSIPEPGGHVAGKARGKREAFGLAVTMALLLAFSAFLVYAEDPWAIGRGIVVALAYVIAIALSIALVADPRNPKRRTVLILVIGTIAVLGCAYALSGGNGYPSTSVVGTNTITKCTTPSSCAGYDVPVHNAPLALGYNAIAWMPLVGVFLYSISGLSAASSRAEKFARLAVGSVIAAAILLNVVGIGWSNLQTLPSIHSPLNPYPATGECDSSNADGGCAYVSTANVLVDYVFWLSVAILASLSIDAIVSRRKGSEVRTRARLLFPLALLFVLLVGLVVIPSTVDESGVLVNSGSSFSFNPSISFIRVPFAVTHNETLAGKFDGSAAVDAYVLTSNQYMSNYTYIGYCPIPRVAPILANISQGSLAANLGKGSYDLLFCSSVHVPSIQVTITNSIILSSVSP